MNDFIFAETNSSIQSYSTIHLTSGLTEQVIALSTTVADALEKMSVLKIYSAYNDVTGKYITLSPELSFCPVLIGRNESLVFLFRFVEILDEIIDYEDIQSRLPELSFKQISGAMAFLRKLAQFNIKDIDIDAFIDENDTVDRDLHSALSAPREANFVLNIP